MDDRETKVLAAAEASVEAAHAMNTNFLAFCSQNKAPQGLAARLSVENGNLVVTALGEIATAKPRYVLTEPNDFAVEYVFNCSCRDSVVEVARLYLTTAGISSDLSDDSRICDFNNKYAPRHIYVHVVQGMLKSSLFAPTPS